MLSVGVPILRLLSWGGWASEASVMPYLRDNGNIALFAGEIIFFEWLQFVTFVRASYPMVVDLQM
jgi:hypothetical protein